MDPCVAFITATQGQHIHECRWTLTIKTLWLLQDGALKQNGQRLLQPSNLSGSPSRRLSVRLCLGHTHVVQFGKSAVESLALVNWQADFFKLVLSWSLYFTSFSLETNPAQLVLLRDHLVTCLCLVLRKGKIRQTLREIALNHLKDSNDERSCTA